MNLTENQKIYLDVMMSQMKKVVEKNNISEADFIRDFEKIFVTCHAQYQNFLCDLLENDKIKNELLEITYKEAREA